MTDVLPDANQATAPPGVSSAAAAIAAPRHRRWRVWRGRIASVVLPAAALAAALAGWQAWVRLDHVPPYVMAPFSTVAQTAFDERGFLLSQAWVTLYEALFGLGVAMVLGTMLALLIDSSFRVEQALWPFLIGSQVIPVIAFAPVIIVWFGFGLTPKVIIVALLGTFLVTIEGVAGLKSLEPEKALLARSMGATRRQIYLKIKLPHSLPNLFNGIKLAGMLCLTGAVVGEFVASQNGLGHYITYEGGLSDTTAATAGVLYLVVMGVAIYGTLALAERLAIPWHTSHRAPVGAEG